MDYSSLQEEEGPPRGGGVEEVSYTHLLRRLGLHSLPASLSIYSNNIHFGPFIHRRRT